MQAINVSKDGYEFEKVLLNCTKFLKYNLKGAFSGLRQFLATESPLKMMKMLFISP